MYIELKGGIDLEKTEKSGQCFRWIRERAGVYTIPAFGILFRVSECKKGIEAEIVSKHSKDDEERFYAQIADYFDSGLDYSKIRKMPDDSDEFLSSAAKAGDGIRIIKQDPFETLITFILSQRKSIPAIKTSVERICASNGRKIAGTDVYDLPSPAELAKLSADELSACGLGYRAPYIHAAAEAFAHGEMDAAALSEMDDETLLNSLMLLHGVGLKVANCTALFGFHRLDLFPVDVWIQRALDKYYNGTFPLEKYHPYNGIMQQFIFAARDTIL